MWHKDTFFAVLSQSKREGKRVGYSYRQSNGRGEYVKECPGQYLQNKGPRTVLMKDCPYNDQEKFQRKRYVFYESDSRFNPRLIHKSSFLIGQVPIEKYGLKTLFLLFNI